MSKIIDMHTHMFPEDVINNWGKYASRDYYFKLLTDPAEGTIQRYATAEEAIELADEAGVEKIVMQGWYWNDHELCKFHNDYMYEVIEKYPDRFEAYMSINPTFGNLAINEVERNYKRGFAGIGELGPGGNDFKLSDTSFLKLMETAQHYNLPVNIHSNEPVGIGSDFAGKDKTFIGEFIQLAKRFPDLTLIMAHLGGGLPFYEHIPEVKKALKNVYYDLAANPLVYETRSIRTVVDIVGAEKVLFGSDFPLKIYPSIPEDKTFKLFIDDIKRNANLNKEEWNKIMRTNAKKILSKNNS